MEPHDQITGVVVDAAYKLHTKLGPGLIESVYEILLARMLEERGLKVDRQKPIAIEFDGIKLPDAFRVDLLVEDRVVVELKALESLAPVHVRQTVTYLRLLDQPVGLLINFGAAKLKDGLRRISNSRASCYEPEFASSAHEGEHLPAAGIAL
jgi:iron complex transport system substrate-binding protein